jgi:hypothetical protein
MINHLHHWIFRCYCVDQYTCKCIAMTDVTTSLTPMPRITEAAQLLGLPLPELFRQGHLITVERDDQRRISMNARWVGNAEREERCSNAASALDNLVVAFEAELRRYIQNTDITEHLNAYRQAHLDDDQLAMFIRTQYREYFRHANARKCYRSDDWQRELDVGQLTESFPSAAILEGEARYWRVTADFADVPFNNRISIQHSSDARRLADRLEAMVLTRRTIDERRLAFAMGLHRRLGGASPVSGLDDNIAANLLNSAPFAAQAEQAEVQGGAAPA